eukprot:2709485-Pyramimonas_sp.AAC.1
MGISGKLKYLGMFLGPDVEWDSWHAPLSKYQSRCAMIAAGGSATEVTVLLYRRRAVTVLSYVAQFMIIPLHL